MRTSELTFIYFYLKIERVGVILHFCWHNILVQIHLKIKIIASLQMLVKLYLLHLTPHFFNRNRSVRAVNLSLKVLPVSKQTITEVFFPAVRPVTETSLKPDNGLNMTSWIWEMRKVIGDRRMLVRIWKDGIIDHVGGHLSLPLPERLYSEPELLTGFER